MKVKGMIADLLEEETPKVKQKFAEIDDPVDYIKCYAAILPYVVPKQKEIEITHEGTGADLSGLGEGELDRLIGILRRIDATESGES